MCNGCFTITYTFERRTSDQSCALKDVGKEEYKRCKGAKWVRAGECSRQIHKDSVVYFEVPVESAKNSFKFITC